jgi:Mg-chelatase subunit ChlD
VTDAGTPDRPSPAALRSVVAWLRRVMDDTDAQEPHSVLVTDPQTSSRHVIGPYPNRLHARIAAELIKAQNVKLDPDLADLSYEVVLHFSPEDPR